MSLYYNVVNIITKNKNLGDLLNFMNYSLQDDNIKEEIIFKKLIFKKIWSL